MTSSSDRALLDVRFFVVAYRHSLNCLSRSDLDSDGIASTLSALAPTRRFAKLPVSFASFCSKRESFGFAPS